MYVRHGAVCTFHQPAFRLKNVALYREMGGGSRRKLKLEKMAGSSLTGKFWATAYSWAILGPAKSSEIRSKGCICL